MSMYKVTSAPWWVSTPDQRETSEMVNITEAHKIAKAKSADGRCAAINPVYWSAVKQVYVLSSNVHCYYHDGKKMPPELVKEHMGRVIAELAAQKQSNSSSENV